jgi:hypothetical protein
MVMMSIIARGVFVLDALTRFWSPAGVAKTRAARQAPRSRTSEAGPAKPDPRSRTRDGEDDEVGVGDMRD